MPFNRPSLTDLDEHIAADIDARLPGTDPRLRRSMLGILTRAIAGAHHELYGFGAWIARQAFPDTAEDDELLRWAAIWGIERQAAKQATGTILVSGTAPRRVRDATIWASGDGVEYRRNTDTRTRIGATGTVSVPVIAVLGGANGNAAVGVKLNLVSPQSGVLSEATVTVALAGGADIESIAGVRKRLLDRLRTPPRGGTVADYVLWARSGHQDVTRAWARANTPEIGQVTVYIMTDDATDNGIPVADTVAAVQAYIDARRPVTAAVTVAAPAPVALDVTINNVMPDTTSVRAAIEAEIADLIIRDSEPGGTILLSHLREAVSTAAGEFDHQITAPPANIAHLANQIAVLGDITWTTS